MRRRGSWARELEEETGYCAGHVEHVMTYQPMPGMVDAEHFVFVGTNPATDAGTAKPGQGTKKTTRKTHDRAVYLRKLWRTRRDSNPQPSDP